MDLTTFCMPNVCQPYKLACVDSCKISISKLWKSYLFFRLSVWQHEWVMGRESNKVFVIAVGSSYWIMSFVGAGVVVCRIHPPFIVCTMHTLYGPLHTWQRSFHTVWLLLALLQRPHIQFGCLFASLRIHLSLSCLHLFPSPRYIHSTAVAAAAALLDGATRSTRVIQSSLSRNFRFCW